MIHSLNHPDEQAPRPTRIARATMAVHVVLLAAFIFAFRYIPLQDYPEWLYHGVLLERIATGDHGADGYVLAGCIPPNSVSTIAIAVLHLMFPAEPAGKLFLLAAMLLLYAGIVRFMRITLHGCDTMIAWMALLLVFNYSFWLGNLSFYAGLGISLYGAHLLLVRRWAASVWGSMLLVTLAYLSHFFAWFFILWAGIAAALLRRDRVQVRVLAVAALPSLLLFARYLMARPAVPGIESAPETAAGFTLLRAHLFVAAVQPVQRFKGVAEPGAAMEIANYLFAAGIGVAVVLAAIRFARRRRAGLNVVLALPLPALMLALPLFSSGIVFPAQRLVVFFLINTIAYLALEYGRIRAWLAGFFILFATIGVCYGFFFTARFDAMARAGCGPDRELYLSADRKGGTDGFVRLEFYSALHVSRQLRLFETGLVLSRDSVISRRRAAEAILPDSSEHP
ncbi:MAG: hypothetical protein JST22_00035 [Bacteroidetes bacterium]|nr:hypothetical protein [Bacteroidota bacterium]